MRSLIGIGVLALLLVGAATVWSFAAGGHTGPVPVTVALNGVQCHSCANKLQHELSTVKGVTEVSVTMKPAQVTAKLDEKKIGAGAFVRTVAAKLAKIEPGQQTSARLVAYIDAKMCAGLKTMCKECFTEIPAVLKKVKGVKDVTLDETGKVATITLTEKATVTTTAIAQALKKSRFGFTTQFTAPAAKAQTKDAGAQGGAACH